MGTSRQFRVSNHAVLISEEKRGDSEAVVVYKVFDRWTVTISGDQYAPTTYGPIRLEVVTEFGTKANAADDITITTEVLRAVPMQDARDRIKRLLVELAIQEGHATPLPDRFKSDADFALLAKVYADRVAKGDRNPFRYLTETYRIPRNTLSARIRVARDRELLTRPSGTDRGRLTPKGRKLVKEWERENG